MASLFKKYTMTSKLVLSCRIFTREGPSQTFFEGTNQQFKYVFLALPYPFNYKVLGIK